MRMLTGAILILAAEQAFAHAHLVNFPYDGLVRDVLIPGATVSAIVGLILLIWGLFSEVPAHSPHKIHADPPTTAIGKNDPA